MRKRTIFKGAIVLLVGLVVTVIAVIANLDVSQYKGDIAAEVKRLTGRDLVIDGELGLALSLNPAVTVSGVRFANAEWGSRPVMLGLGRADAEVELLPLVFGDIRVRRLVLADVDLLLETDKQGRGNWEFAKAGPAAASTAATTAPTSLPEVARVTLRNIKITWRDGRAGTEQVVSLARLDGRTKGTGQPVDIVLAMTVDGAAVEAEGQVGPLSQLLAGEKPYPLAMEVRGLGAKVSLAGSIARPTQMAGLDLKVSVSGQSLSEIGKFVDVELPAVDYRLTAKVTGSADRLALSGTQLAVGDSNLSGDIQLGLSSKRPRIDAALSSSLLDVDALLPKSGGAVKTASPPAAGNGATKRLFSDAALPLAGLAAVDALVRINAGKIRAGGVTIVNLVATVDLKNGSLAVEPLAAELSGGQIKGRVMVDGRDAVARLNSEINLAGLDIGLLLKELGGGDEVAGHADADLRLTGSGGSMRALMAGLDGRAVVIGGKGRVNNKALEFLSADVLGSITPFLEKKDAAVMNCMVARFDIEKGIAHSRGILFDTETMTIAGDGKIDLREETLDLVFSPRPKQASFLNLAMPVLVRGTLAEPSILPDPAGVAKKAAGIALSSINPLVALVPLIADKMTGDNNPCLAAIDSAKNKPRTGQPAVEKKEEGGVGGFIKGLGKALGGQSN